MPVITLETAKAATINLTKERDLYIKIRNTKNKYQV